MDYELVNLEYVSGKIANETNVNKDIEEMRIDYNADYDDFGSFLERI